MIKINDVIENNAFFLNSLKKFEQDIEAFLQNNESKFISDMEVSIVKFYREHLLYITMIEKEYDHNADTSYQYITYDIGPIKIFFSMLASKNTVFDFYDIKNILIGLENYIKEYEV